MKKYLFLVLFLLSAIYSKADEGMWLLPDLKTQNAATLLELGLELPIDEVYNPAGLSIKDAVVHFGRGCTGEVVSAEGLVFTNHHCGYGAIQKLSSVEHDYLTDGYWAKDRSGELPCEGLTVTFIDKILDVTSFVEAELAKNKEEFAKNFVSTSYLRTLSDLFIAQEGIELTPFTEVDLRPFYGGNRYMLFIKTVYKDIRMVGAPPSSVGKYGADTDNWMWPRHTGDFSVFRIYANADGTPAEYSESNVPYKAKKHLSISLKGIQENDFVFLMGFPGSNWRYMIADEVEERMETTNYLRKTVRGRRLSALMDEMQKDPAVRIHYASKYASAANYWKNAIGMNEGLVKLNVIDTKKEQQEKLLAFGRKEGTNAYQEAFTTIQEIVAERRPHKLHQETLRECFIGGLDFTKIPSTENLQLALTSNNSETIQSAVDDLAEVVSAYFEDIPFPNVEKRMAYELITVYKEIIPVDEQIDILTNRSKKYKGDVDKFLEDVFSNSIFSSVEKFEAFIKKPSIKKLEQDPLISFRTEVDQKIADSRAAMRTANQNYTMAHKTWVKGMMELRQANDIPIYPDANSTIRLTYGSVRGYKPSDGKWFAYYTTLEGVMEKEDPTNWEFVVPDKLKILYQHKEYGRYANEKGEMPVNFIVDTDNTGGNSGSPLMNSKGELVGIGFDRNYEGLTGDIAFRPSSQRAACVDIRYILFIIDKYADAQHVIDELTIVE